MIQENLLDQLLDGVEIEWKAIGETGELVRGSGLPKTDFTESGVPAIHYGQIYTYYGLFTHTTKSYVSEETSKKLKKVNFGDVVITNTSENLEDVGTPLVYLGKEQAVTGGHATILKPSKGLLGQYFAYYTQTRAFFKDKRKYAKGIKVIDVSAKDLSKIQIPIPCPDNPEKSLAIQSEIVRILDRFTELTTELTAELIIENNVRKKQFNYYRDLMLSFEKSGVEWKTLDEVADIYDSLHKTPRYSENGLSMIRVTNIKGGYVNLSRTLKVDDEVFADFTKKYLPKKDDLVMSRVGSYGNVGIIPSSNAVCMGQNTVVIHPLIHNKYLFHILVSNLGQSFIKRNVSGGNQKTLSLKSIKAIPIPIVCIKQQERIADTLDKFDTLSTSLGEGLTREIELRQKQYEYYRDLLLSFPKKEQETV